MTNTLLVSFVGLTLLQTAVQGLPQQRYTEGVRLARQINSAQIAQAGARENKFLPLQDLAVQVPPGWDVKLDVTAAGFWFMATDTTHVCDLAFVSNQRGIIFEARPLR